jgi:hypothetical protein
MADYYSLRRLSPYLGVIQVIDVGQSCAYSTDGRHWQVRSMNDYGRYRLTGVWADYEQGTQAQASGNLGEALRARPPIPFPGHDHYELWLLRKDTLLPLALLKTRRWEREMVKVDDPAWYPFLLDDNSFTAPSLVVKLAPQHPAARPARHRDVLERLVNMAARPLPVAQWFERHPDGGGTGHFGLRVDADLQGRTLPCEAFPELLVDERWDDAADATVIREYHDWNAAQLLAHQGLSEDTRRRLEQAACRQPEKLLDPYPMIPEILDEEAIKVALVSAKLIRAT